MYIIERKKHRHVSTWAAKKGVSSIGMHLEKKVIFKLITFFFFWLLLWTIFTLKSKYCLHYKSQINPKKEKKKKKMNKNYFEGEGGDMNCLHKILTKSVNSLKNQW